MINFDNELLTQLLMAFEIRFNRGRTFENEAFRRIAKILAKYFEDKNLDGLLIGNAFVESNEFLKPDLLLYSSFGTIIIDLKDGEGNLRLPQLKDFETTAWTINGRVIKAGSDRNINPYVQLKRIISRYLKTLNEQKSKHPAIITPLLPDNRETPDFLYYSSMVLFSGRIQNEKEIIIPYPVNRWFFIADEITLLNKIADISNNGKYSTAFGNIIKSVFKADPYKLDNTIIEEEYKPHRNIEYTSIQKECLEKIKGFLSKNDHRVLILRGKEKSGKSFLIPEISQLALENGNAQVETLTVTKRIASKLNRNSEVQFTSIYSMIYGGVAISEIEEEEKTVTEYNKDEYDSEEDVLESEIIPLRKATSDIEDTTVFIIDEAQLLNSSHFESENLQFGSGNLLDDFLSFVSLSNTKRKIIFIGDPFQLSYGKYETSALSAPHIENLIGRAPLVIQIHSEEESISSIDKNVDFIANQISEAQFNQLKLFRGEDVVEIKTEAERIETINSIIAKNEVVKVLCYKNESAHRLNEDIRAKIYGRTGGLKIGDHLVLDNNIRIISHDPHAMPTFINNGCTIEVIKSGMPQSVEPIVLKGRKTKVILTFRELQVCEQGREIQNSILILENYRVNTKGRLTIDEMLALKIFQQRIILEKEKISPFEKSSYQQSMTSDPKYKELQNDISMLQKEVDSGEKKKTLLDEKKSQLNKLVKRYKNAFRFEIRRELLSSNEYFNLAFVRYAYALTVHKTLGEYYPNVIFDVNMDRGRTNRDYFQWLYTGISRAQKKLFVINFEEIHPLQGVRIGEFDQNCITTSEPKGEDKIAYEIIPAPDEFKQNYADNVLSELVLNNAYTIIKWMAIQGIEGAFEYNSASKHLVKIKSKGVTIIFNFSGQGVPGIPRIEKGNNEIKLKFLSWISHKEDVHSAKFPNNWRCKIYKKWEEKLDGLGIKWKAFETHGYKDRIWFSSEASFLVVDVDFNGESFISGIKLYKTSAESIWNLFTTTISNIDYLNA